MKEYKVGLEHVVQTLADGRVVAPGERTKLSDADVKENARLFSEGKLIPISDKGDDVVDKAVAAYERQVAKETEALEQHAAEEPDSGAVQTEATTEGGDGQ